MEQKPVELISEVEPASEVEPVLEVKPSQVKINLKFVLGIVAFSVLLLVIFATFLFSQRQTENSPRNRVFETGDGSVVNRTPTNTDVVTLAPGAITNCPSELSKGLVGYWKMDEGNGNTAYDSSGYGTVVTMNSISWTNGRLGPAILNTIGTIADTPYFAGFTSFTVSAWIKPTQLFGSDHNILQKGDWDDPDLAYRLMYQTDWGSGAGNPNGFWRLQLRTSTGEYFANAPSSPSKSKENVWHLIIGVYNSSDGRVKIFDNGIEIGSNSAFGKVKNNSRPVLIASGFVGTVDDVRIYNRALNMAEISSLYNEGYGCASTVGPSSN
ncbi:MAG: LamG domain-containing protein [bacterium]|nr:LamG domain-containing protein [bacterium]